jgi:3-hydroxybutyryl-CoA dehydrogenase
MDITKVLVVGSGYMGNGIAQAAALAGYDVTMCDIASERLEAGMREIDSSLERLLRKERITPEARRAALQNIRTATGLDGASGADIVVEAVPENLELKKELFAELENTCPPQAILATNTSAIPITAIAAAVASPQRVVGTHFFGPVPMMRLCEVISGLLTSEETLAAAAGWVTSLGKEAVLVRKDHTGFVANRVMIPASLEVARMVEEGIATPPEIDLAITMGTTVGPLEIMDNAGIEVSVNSAMSIYNDTHEPRFFPPPLMRRMVAAGMLGRKSGRGFYDYSSGGKAANPAITCGASPREELSEEAMRERNARIAARFMFASMLEAARVVEAGVATPADTDRAVKLGFNMPVGPLEIADGIGLDEVVSRAESIYRDTHDEKYLPPRILLEMVARGRTGSRGVGGFHE